MSWKIFLSCRFLTILSYLLPFLADSKLFDASQYAFFGNDIVEEVELGGLDDDEEILVGGIEDDYQLDHEEVYSLISFSNFDFMLLPLVLLLL